MSIPTLNLYPDFRACFPGEYSAVFKDQQLPEIKDQLLFDARDPKDIDTHDQQSTINDTDHRISFFRALREFFTSKRIFKFLMPPLMPALAYLLPPIKLILIELLIASALVGIIAIVAIGKQIYDFLNSPEYLLTKGTKKLIENWEQLKKRKESHKEQLNKLYRNDSDKQKEILQKRKLIRKIENEMRIIEIALRKLHDMKNTQNNN